MATFYVQTDKCFYFAEDTVNGKIFVNVGVIIQGAQGLSLKFTGYKCVKLAEAQELRRPAPQRHYPGQPPHLLNLILLRLFLPMSLCSQMSECLHIELRNI